MTNIEAMKLALDALEEAPDDYLYQAGTPKKAQAIAALRQAISEALADHVEQSLTMVAEPVSNERLLEAAGYIKKTEPVKRPPNCGTGYCSCIECPYKQAEQEPVAWLYDWENDGEIITGWVTKDFQITKFNNGHNVRPLYTAPPQREWVSLTDDEIDRVADEFGYGYIDIAHGIEAKLKEKNS